MKRRKGVPGKDTTFIRIVTEDGDMTIHFPREEEEKWKQFAANVITGNFPKGKRAERLAILRHRYLKAWMFYVKDMERAMLEAKYSMIWGV